jgi:hypothetical protein
VAELSDPEKPHEHGLTATKVRSARHIHCRMNWTGVQVTLWQLSREKSLIAKRSEMKGNSGHTSKANFGSDICEFESSHPSQPVRSLPCDFRVCENRDLSQGHGAVRQSAACRSICRCIVDRASIAGSRKAASSAAVILGIQEPIWYGHESRRESEPRCGAYKSRAPI